MRRIQGANVAVNLHGAGKNGYKDGNKALGIPATDLNAEAMNALQEEPLNVIEAAGLTPSHLDNTQLLQAINLLIASSSQSASTQGQFKNLKASATGLNANVSVTADELVVKSAAGQYKTLSTVNLTIAGTSVGANGLDSGALAVSTWYSVWVIWNGTTTAGLLSLSATAPTMPSGYTHKARAGWIRTDATGNKYPLSFLQNGRRITYKVASGSNVPNFPIMASGAQGSTSTPTWVAVSVSNFVPATAATIKLVSTDTAVGEVILAPNADFGALGSLTNPPPFVQDSSTSAYNGLPCELQLESTNIYRAAPSGITACTGWEDSL